MTAREFVKEFRSEEVERLEKQEKELVKLCKIYIRKDRRRRILRALIYPLVAVCAFFECVWAGVMYLLAIMNTFIDKHCSKRTKQALTTVAYAILLVVGTCIASTVIHMLVDIMM